MAHVDGNPHTCFHPATANRESDRTRGASSRHDPPAPGSSHACANAARASDERHPHPCTDPTNSSADAGSHARRRRARGRDPECATDCHRHPASLGSPLDTDAVSDGRAQANQDGHEVPATGGDGPGDATSPPAITDAHRNPLEAASDTHPDTPLANAYGHPDARARPHSHTDRPQ